MAIDLSGYVHNLQDAPLASVTLTLSGAASETATTNSSGYYEFLGIPEGNYTLVPSLTTWLFNPTKREYTNLTTSLVNQNFKGGQEPLSRPIKSSLLYDDYKTEQLHSADIAIADGTTGQDVTTGTGIKTTHIQTDAITEVHTVTYPSSVVAYSSDWVDVVSTSFTLTVPAKVYIFTAFTAYVGAALNNAGEYRLLCDGVTRHSTVIGRFTNVEPVQVSVSLHWVGDLSAGSHTTGLQLRLLGGGNALVRSDDMGQGITILSVIMWKK